MLIIELARGDKGRGTKRKSKAREYNQCKRMKLNLEIAACENKSRDRLRPAVERR